VLWEDMKIIGKVMTGGARTRKYNGVVVGFLLAHEPTFDFLQKPAKRVHFRRAFELKIGYQERSAEVDC
jgi:hypothetical protein